MQPAARAARLERGSPPGRAHRAATIKRRFTGALMLSSPHAMRRAQSCSLQTRPFLRQTHGAAAGLEQRHTKKPAKHP